MRILLCLILLSFLCSCQNNLPDKRLLIEEYYKAHVEELKKDKRAECNERILIAVESEIDSIIDNLINKDLLDTLAFPVKPIKPKAAKHIINKVDTFSIER